MGGEYFYVCGSKQYGWSSVYKFTAMRNFTEFGEYPRIIFYGDLGDTNSISLSSIQDMVETTDINAILHIGDFAYDLLDNNGLVGDQFMMDIEPIAAYTPYMTAVGNHEAGYNYSHYRNRFTMPNFSSENMLYSWNIGPVHIISFSSEVYFQPNTHLIAKDYDAVKAQFEWLANDLTIANLLENRKKQPWIITMAHRPMYCSTPNDDACTWMKNPLRDGILVFGKLRYGLEQMFYDFEVDLEMWGHEHIYERTYPVYRRIPYTKNISVVNGTSYYHNPIVPVHIIAGSPGNKEMNGKPLVFTNNSWSAVTTTDYSFSYMEIYNSTHLHIQQINGETKKLIDDLWLIK
jgi:hypothetical protein